MEVGQADDVELQHAGFMKKKWHPYSLSKSKVVYARDYDPDDTIVLRNLYPKIEDIKSIFGLKKVENIETLFYSLLLLFKEKIDVLRSRVKYVKKTDFDEVVLAANERGVKIEQLGRFLHEKKDFDNGGSSVRFLCEHDAICVKMYPGSDFPSIEFINETKEKEKCNSCNPFIGEGIKLLKYLNTRFNFTTSSTLKNNKKNPELFRSDSFFN